MNYITKLYSGRIARKNYFFGLLFIPIMFCGHYLVLLF